MNESILKFLAVLTKIALLMKVAAQPLVDYFILVINGFLRFLEYLISLLS